jgi:hypothetical protein
VPATLLDFAMVHAAIYDAVQAIEGRFKPYHVKIPKATGSPAAATAKAGHDVLVSLFPAQTALVDQRYHDYLALHGLAETDPGVAVGAKAAAGILALRSNDGRFPMPPPPPFIGGTAPGVWRPTESFIGTPPGPPPSFAPMAIPWLGTVKPFTLKRPDQFRAGPPPSLKSFRYARDYYEVKTLGSDVGSGRSDEQTELAYFWLDNFITLWNRTLRSIATDHLAEIADSARLFALANMAGADAAITAWDSKNAYVFWRPLTAIREGRRDGNPFTVGDPDWRPFSNTPNYPDYTSGANNVTGAFTTALALFFRTNHFPFDITTGNALAVQKTRHYTRFSQPAAEVVDVRVLHGIHFRFADEVARRQGRRVAQWAYAHFLRPVDDDHDDHDDDDDDDDHHDDDDDD